MHCQAMHGAAPLTGSRMFTDVQLAQAKRCGAWRLPQAAGPREQAKKCQGNLSTRETNRAEERKWPKSRRRILCFLRTNICTALRQ